MRLVTATLIVDRTNLHPVDPFTTTFNQDGVSFVLTTTRSGKGVTVGLMTPADSAPYEMVLNDPEATPTQQQQRVAEWIVFVVDMTLVIRSLTNA